MHDNSPSPEIYWVVGDGTGVGKTTISCALIRALNRAGIPAAGFKPYAATLLAEGIAFLAAGATRSPSRLHGEDALRLVEASPLTSVEMLDVVACAQFLCHSRWPGAVMARTGAEVLGNAEYFRSDDATLAQERYDLRALLAKTGLPFAGAKPAGALDFFRAPALSPEKQKPAFEFLARLGAAALVCEGAGRFIPNWQDCPGVNHVICIAEGRVTFFPRANVKVTFSPDGPLGPVAGLAAYLERSDKRRHYASLHYVADPGQRNAAADRIVLEMLRMSGGRAIPD